MDRWDKIAVSVAKQTLSGWYAVEVAKRLPFAREVCVKRTSGNIHLLVDFPAGYPRVSKREEISRKECACGQA